MINTIDFYPRFKRVTNSPLFKAYLRWGYSQAIKDFSKLKYRINFSKKNFTALLCGCAGDVTADEFIKFVLGKNPNAKIIIVDIGKEQITAVDKLVRKKYKSNNITTIQKDILNLKSIPPNSVDWIETDAVLGYFNNKELTRVLEKWNKWLSDDGFVTMREAAVEGPISHISDQIKRWVAKVHFGSLLYRRSRIELVNAFEKTGFDHTCGLTPIPSLLRFSMIKE